MKRKNEIQLLLMILISICSQIFALYKSRYTATTFGATDAMDAYNYATTISNFLFIFVTTGVTTVIIPAYVKNKDKKAIDSFITIIYGCVFILMLIIYLFRGNIIELMTNRGLDFKIVFSNLLLYTFIIQATVSFLAVTTAYFQCKNRYIIPKLIVLISNFIVFIALLVFKNITINQYIYILLLGSLVNFVVDIIIALKLGFRYKPTFAIKSPETRKLLIIFLPTLFSSGVYKIHTLVDSLIATNLGTGQLTILTYSSQIVNIVNSFVISNLTVYAYPKIVEKIKQREGKEKLWEYSILFHAIVCLIICGIIAVGDYVINIIFVGGNFSHSDGKILYICACIYIFGQQTNIIRDLIYRYFYANDDTKTTFYNSIIISTLNIILSIILVKKIGIYGIIIGTIIAGAASLILILIRFKKKFSLGNNFKKMFCEYLKTLICTGITIGLILICKKYIVINNQTLSILLYGILTVIIFICCMVLSKNKSLKVRL